MNRNTRLALLILTIIGISLFLVSWLKNPSPLAFGTVAAGILTFFNAQGTTTSSGHFAGSADERLRSAIASAVVVQYLVLVGLVTYFTNEDAFGKLLPITQSLLASFTATVGIVIAFSFGASAYVEGKRIEAKRTDAAKGTPNASPNDA